MATLVSINRSLQRGKMKTPIDFGSLLQNTGLEQDAHADGSHRQLSLLAEESILKMAKQYGAHLTPGMFAENLTTRGICLYTLPIGTKLCVGPALLEVTQIGKECHSDCEIRKKVGTCVMPKEGIFARILHGGILKPGQSIFLADAKPRIKILIASDKASTGEREDKCEAVIRKKLRDITDVLECKILPDEQKELADYMKEVADTYSADILLTSGGTGFSPRDVTPEATKEIIEKEVPGIAEGIRAYSMQITPMTMLSRATAGIRKQTLIINLPGSPKACQECIEVLMPILNHATENLRGTAFECAKIHEK